MVHMGEEVADFTLKDQHGERFWLSDAKGKKICLFFHPFAWTPVCSEEMKAVEGRQQEFASLNTIAVGISIDSVYAKKAWAESLGITKTRLLSDFWPTGQVSREFGVFRENNGFSDRATIILDEARRIVFFRKYGMRDLPDIDEVIAFLRTRA
jgi:peroxiredoxin